MTMISQSQMDTLSKATGLTEKQAALGQEQFLKLMLTQLQNQDPTAPMESAEFLSQLAQFGTVSGIQGLQQQFVDVAESLSADRALRGASLLGKSALTPAESIALKEEGATRFTLDLQTPVSDVRLELQDSQGRTVRTIQLGPQNQGLLDVSWAGLDDDGRRVAPGTYRVSALASQGMNTEMVEVFSAHTIKGVELAAGSGDLRLELDVERTIDLAQVRRIDQ
jgi:flagellar basal-body rod modification protein FlgD